MMLFMIQWWVWKDDVFDGDDGTADDDGDSDFDVDEKELDK